MRKWATGVGGAIIVALAVAVILGLFNDSPWFVNESMTVNCDSSPETIDWDDARVFQATGDFRFNDESKLLFLVVGKPGLDFLERDLAMQLKILGNKNLPKTSLGMFTHDSESRRVLTLLRGGCFALVRLVLFWGMRKRLPSWKGDLNIA